MIPRLYIVDGNALGYHAHQSGAKLRSGSVETTAVFGSLRTLRNIYIQHGAALTLIVWDGRSWRKDVDKTYKANREATPEQIEMREAYHKQVPHIKEAYEALGIPQLQADNMEADDLAAIFTERLSARGSIVRLITRDRDWWQLIRANVTWHDFHTDETVNVKTFKDTTGYPTPRAFAESKALQGDRGDNVSGVGGIGEVKAQWIIDRYGSVQEFLNSLLVTPEGEKPPHKAIRDFHADKAKHAKFEENMRMVDLTSTRHFPPIKGLTLRRGNHSPEAFRKKCIELGFHSITPTLDKFMLPFKQVSGEPLVIS